MLGDLQRGGVRHLSVNSVKKRVKPFDIFEIYEYMFLRIKRAKGNLKITLTKVPKQNDKTLFLRFSM